ncbi:gastric intrinsic factor [Trichonephila clavipes]|nr:gastric intrinsic factor [Trichonephila clavipes]
MPLRHFQRQYDQLLQFERWRIISMIEAGWSARQVARELGHFACVPTASSTAIQAQVSPSLGAPVSSRIIRRHLSEVQVGSRRPLRGLPSTPTIDASNWSGAAHEKTGLQRNGTRSSLATNPVSISVVMTILFVRGEPVVNASILHLLYSDTPLPQLESFGMASCASHEFGQTRGNKVLNVPGVASTRARLISWFKQRRKSGSTVDKWGFQLHRVAVALHLANESIFSPGNTTGQEISYELTIQLLHHLSKDKKMSSQELALYIHAMLVACMDPRDFYGLNLVQELRKRTEEVNYTNPFQILVLCNAGDTMTTKDVDRVTAAYDSQRRPFWTDTQALSSLALACMSTKSNLVTDERILKDMLQELKKHQFRNGTVDNLKTTALVVQALLIYDSYDKDFDMKSALQSILQSVSGHVTLLNAYYALPVLTGNSLLNVSSNHCKATPETEAEALEKALNVNGETISVQFSIWLGDKIELARTWRLKMHPNNSIYDVIEAVAKIDNRQKVEYNVVEGKPFVTSLGGIEDDPERGTFWFVHLRNISANEEPKLIQQSKNTVNMI